MRSILLTAFTLLVFAAPALAGNGQPSAKFAATTSDHVLIEPTEAQDWTTIMSAGLKLPSQKELFVQAAVECGLFTRTSVGDQATDAADDDTADRSSAEAVVRGRAVILDENNEKVGDAHPGEITLCARSQRLTALFNGICYDDDGDGAVQYSECQNDEELDLAVKQLQATAFNFILANLPSGYYTVAFQAMVETRTGECSTTDLLGNCTGDATSDATSAEAKAMVGNGSLSVEEVRMVQGADGTDGDPADDSDSDYFDLFMDFGL